MIDPMVSLAFAVYSNKGAYALLLSSGISRSSGIPTGWEVVLDLIRKVAKLEGENCEPDPANWFRKKHGAEPDYSKLLDAVAKTPAERQQLLRGYFEPTEDERAQQLKLPSAAHRAIAQLASLGYIRVIVTTNFDRLIEKALEEVGIAPSIISTADQLAGALPVAQAQVTVVKLHGDYLDTRIKNTDVELAAYDKAIDGLIDRIFDEYGLLICGWSADWDVALRAAIDRCPSRRFSTYWTARGALSEKAQKLVQSRRAQVISIQDANSFFGSLSEKVRALSDLDAPHPLSAKLAAATVKRYLVDPSARIRLRDLIHEETERLISALDVKNFPGGTTRQHPEELLARVRRYESLSEILTAILITSSHWGEPHHVSVWSGSLERLAGLDQNRDGLVYLINLRRYPLLLLYYASGLAALAANNYPNLAALFALRGRNERQEREPVIGYFYPYAVIEQKIGHMLPGLERRHTPANDLLFSTLREPLREYLPDDEIYQSTFDRFEYLYSACHADMKRDEWKGGWWGPTGCFGWRGRWGNKTTPTAIAEELEAMQDKWPPLKAGLFGGSLEQARTAITKFNEFLKHVNFF
jgi:hypothetical protein